MFEHARDTAKLLPSDLAKLLRVNRCTVSFWYNGHASPHVQLMDRVNKLLAIVRLAVDAGDLPLPHGTPRRERHYILTKIILKHAPRLAAPAS